MSFNIAVLAVLAILAFAVFYLIIRMKDIAFGLNILREKLPLTDDMRRQASDTIASLNERIGSLDQKGKADKRCHE